MCGEKHVTTPDELPKAGSPPHVRGKDTNPKIFGLFTRITPACAGKRMQLVLYNTAL